MDRILLADVRKRFWSRTSVRMVVDLALRPKAARSHWFWALDGLTLKVPERGKWLAVVGANGSGKTTLLKVIAGVTKPTSGTVIVHGRAVSLLELFAGMQMDYTGRENIYFNGLLLGMRRHQIREKINSIVDFAGVRKFLDMPFRHYSLGMQMRLGFSTAIHVEADIILMDEVWSIGDREFQSKSMERLLELKRRGVTLIVVSHDLDVVRKLADEALWLHHGRVQAYGLTKRVLEAYLRATSAGAALSGNP